MTNNNIDIDKVITCISNDISSSIKSNLSIIIKSINDSNKTINLVEELLKELPEYKKLRLNYYGLIIKNHYLQWKLNKHNRNIYINIENPDDSLDQSNDNIKVININDKNNNISSDNNKTNIILKKNEEEEEEQEEEEEEEELVLVTINKKSYYKNELTNVLYECLSNEDIGDEVGKLVNDKIVKLKK